MLRALCPRFHGTVLHNGENYLRLEDLTRPFRNPCIIDIKMGRVTWDPDATDAKRVREESKYPPLKMSGFQFLGCRVRYSCFSYFKNTLIFEQQSFFFSICTQPTSTLVVT